ncbi:MAG: ABC transporter substrate-binding protein [Oscillospiraceae bacterium]|nr:ABC transporter substrate-binding protein [Oscillospiraceae bacterium]
MKRIFAVLLSVLMLLGVFSACGKEEFIAGEVRIASMKGPTTMGMVKLMADSEEGATDGDYTVNVYGTADEIVPLVVNGEVDIANVPCNLASVLYNKTNGGVSVIGVNTLGVLYIVQTGDSVKSVADLKGKTIYSTGKGTTPEYVLNNILSKNGIDPEKDVTIEFKSEATEVAAMLENATDAVAVLPQPYVTVAMTKNANISIALDLTKEWEAVEGTSLVTGVTIVRNEFLAQNEALVEKFLEEYKASVEFVNTNNDEAAKLVGSYDIVAEGVAKKALPYCNIVCLTGGDMKSAVETYLSVLYAFNPQSVGGKLPDESFYFVK